MKSERLGAGSSAADLQQRFNDHRAVCRHCFAHSISSIAEAAALCEFGRQLQENWAARYALERPGS